MEYNKYNKEQNNTYEIINEIINISFIDCLFIICKYQTIDEIFNYTNKSKLIKNIDKNKYLNIFINFKKKCTSLLISKLNDILSEYKKEYENKKGENIVSKLLNQIKNLEVYPDLMIIKDDKEEIDKFKNKKIHILYLYNVIIDFISIDNKDIQIIIKELLLIVFNGIELPPLQKISFDEK